jgi:hypothetical protein
MSAAGRNALATRIVLLMVSFAASSVLSALLPLLWHDKLYIDGLTIVRAAPAMEPFGSSYASTAFMLRPVFAFVGAMGIRLQDYGLLYDTDLLIVNGVFGSFFFLGIAIMVMHWKLRVDARNLARFAFTVVLLSPFFFCITKELVLFALTVGILAAHYAGWFGRRAMIAVYVLAVMLCGVYFRIYYMAFAGLMVLHLMLWRRRTWLLLVYVLAAVALVALHDKLPLDLLNKGRAVYLEASSASRIHYYFDDGSGMGFLANRTVTLCMLLVPVNLLSISASYAPFVLMQCWITWKVLRQFMRPQGADKRMAASAVLAFTMVSALFEPDFGSYFRHKVNVLPFMLLLVADFERMPWRAAPAMPRMRRYRPAGR